MKRVRDDPEGKGNFFVPTTQRTPSHSSAKSKMPLTEVVIAISVVFGVLFLLLLSIGDSGGGGGGS